MGQPRGGVAGDGTLILKALLDAGMDDIAVATIWDPIAVTFVTRPVKVRVFSFGLAAKADLELAIRLMRL